MVNVEIINPLILTPVCHDDYCECKLKLTWISHPKRTLEVPEHLSSGVTRRAYLEEPWESSNTAHGGLLQLTSYHLENPESSWKHLEHHHPALEVSLQEPLYVCDPKKSVQLQDPWNSLEPVL